MEKTRTLEEILDSNWGIRIGTREEADKSDYRCQFANSIADLVFKTTENIDEALKEWRKFEGGLEEYVRNIYEVDNGIPLKQLYHYVENDWDDFDLETKEEYDMLVQYVKDKCVEFYTSK